MLEKILELDIRVILVIVLFLDWIFLPNWLKIIVVPGMILHLIEIYRMKELFYSHWLLTAIWYISQFVAVLFVRSSVGIISMIFFILNYWLWTKVKQRYENEWIEEWCKKSVHIIIPMHHGGFPYLGVKIRKIIPIWPWGNEWYQISKKEITSNIPEIIGIEGIKKQIFFGAEKVRIQVRMQNSPKLQTAIAVLPRPNYIKAYIKQYSPVPVYADEYIEKIDAIDVEKNEKK